MYLAQLLHPCRLKSFSCLLNGNDQGVDICYEEKWLESGDRGRFYHLPVLFESFDGRI